jgi:hypothetical protein
VAEAAKDIFMKKKRFADGGMMPRDAAYIEGRDYPIGGNEANKYLGGSAAMVGVTPRPVLRPMPSLPTVSGGGSQMGSQEDINSLYQELLGRAPDPTGIAANRNASAKTIRQSILESPEYQQKNALQLALMKKGGKVKKMAAGGSVKASSASRRGDGCAQRGKTKGRMV